MKASLEPVLAAVAVAASLALYALLGPWAGDAPTAQPDAGAETVDVTAAGPATRAAVESPPRPAVPGLPAAASILLADAGRTQLLDTSDAERRLPASVTKVLLERGAVLVLREAAP